MTMITDDATVLEVLSVSRGDLRLTFEPGDEEKAKQTIRDMLRRGYGIFVETDKGLRPVKRFNPRTMTYVIADTAPPEPPAKTPKAVERTVPVRGTRARAIGATAGG